MSKHSDGKKNSKIRKVVYRKVESDLVLMTGAKNLTKRQKERLKKTIKELLKEGKKIVQ